MRLSLVTAAFMTALSVSPALAADATVEIPVESEGYNWSGVYVGLQGGGGWGDAEITGDLNPVSTEPEGGFLGGHVAALWQFDTVVAGVEAEVNYSWIDDEVEDLSDNFFSSEIEWFGSLNAKIGLPIDRILIHATGGLAIGEVGTGQDLGGGDFFDQSETSVGWTAGGGVDYALTDQFIVGAQYRYYDFGSEAFDNVPAIFTRRDQDVDLHTFSLKASYKF